VNYTGQLSVKAGGQRRAFESIEALFKMSLFGKTCYYYVMQDAGI